MMNITDRQVLVELLSRLAQIPEENVLTNTDATAGMVSMNIPFIPIGGELRDNVERLVDGLMRADSDYSTLFNLCNNVLESEESLRNMQRGCDLPEFKPLVERIEGLSDHIDNRADRTQGIKPDIETAINSNTKYSKVYKLPLTVSWRESVSSFIFDNGFSDSWDIQTLASKFSLSRALDTCPKDMLPCTHATLSQMKDIGQQLSWNAERMKIVGMSNKTSYAEAVAASVEVKSLKYGKRLLQCELNRLHNRLPTSMDLDKSRLDRDKKKSQFKLEKRIESVKIIGEILKLESLNCFSHAGAVLWSTLGKLLIKIVPDVDVFSDGFSNGLVQISSILDNSISLHDLSKPLMLKSLLDKLKQYED